MSRITDSLERLRKELPEQVTLVAVSKFHPAEAISEAYMDGVRDFGESRVQELLSKAPELPSDIRWHFIGHLQTNKVRQLISHVTLIHSIDTMRLLEKVNEEASKADRSVDVLLQIHVAAEETKFGFAPDELTEAITPELLERLRNVRIRGVMGMASNTDDKARITDDFNRIRSCFDKLRHGVMIHSEYFDTVSMGMSGDYRLAIEAGSTMIRIGSDIFGVREYQR